jgi:hypothetical protein
MLRNILKNKWPWSIKSSGCKLKALQRAVRANTPLKGVQVIECKKSLKIVTAKKNPRKHDE